MRTKCEERGEEDVLARGTGEILFKMYSLNGHECQKIVNEAMDTTRWT